MHYAFQLARQFMQTFASFIGCLSSSSQNQRKYINENSLFVNLPKLYSQNTIVLSNLISQLFLLGSECDTNSQSNYSLISSECGLVTCYTPNSQPTTVYSSQFHGWTFQDFEIRWTGNFFLFYNKIQKLEGDDFLAYYSERWSVIILPRKQAIERRYRTDLECKKNQIMRLQTCRYRLCTHQVAQSI